MWDIFSLINFLLKIVPIYTYISFVFHWKTLSCLLLIGSSCSRGNKKCTDTFSNGKYGRYPGKHIGRLSNIATKKLCNSRFANVIFIVMLFFKFLKSLDSQIRLETPILHDQKDLINKKIFLNSCSYPSTIDMIN